MPKWPIREIPDPLVLEIKRAVEATDNATTASLPTLPAYVRRGHDELLDKITAEAAAGRSRLVCVVGDSSTGKTRACWEAAQKLPNDWVLWQPMAPGRARALQDGIGSVEPRTVIWLNEAQQFFMAPSGETGQELAAELRELLSDSARGPILVMGTLWPGYWGQLTAVPPDGAMSDPHSEVRALLSGCDVHVMRTFLPAEMDVATELGATDVRLAQALQYASEQQIVQYLAGAPALLARYKTASAGARSILHAAMDALRLGHGPLLPIALLSDGAEGYLSDGEWDSLADDWLEKALAYCAAPVIGTRGLLTRSRPRSRGGYSGSGSSSRYRLADYIDQQGRQTRQNVPVPETLWQALEAHGDATDCLALGDSARDRGLLRLAGVLYARSGEGADSLARLMDDCGRPDEAHPWWKRAAEQGGPLHGAVQSMPDSAKDTAAQFLQWWWEKVPKSPGHNELLTVIERLGPADAPDALLWLSRVAETGTATAVAAHVRHLEAVGGREAVLQWYQHRAATDAGARCKAADLLIDMGRADEAVTWLESAPDGDFDSRLKLGLLLIDLGRTQDAARWLLEAGGSSSSWTLNDAATSLWAMGRHSDALAMWKHSATLDDRAWPQAAQALEEAGRYTDSVEWRRRAAEAGSGHEWFAYAKSLTHDGQYDEGIDWYQRAVEAGQDASPAEGWQAELLRESGTGQGDLSQWRTTFLESHHFLGKWKRGRLTHQTVHEVLAWLVDLTDRGHPSSLGYAVSLLCDEGRQNEALQWALVLAERGHEGASRQVAQLLADAGDVDESLRWWERVASDSEHGYSALRSGAQILEEAGRQEDAVQWFRRAVEAGDIDILWHTVELYESLGESQEALAWLWQLAVCGWSFALQLTCDVLRRAGRHAEAQQLRRYGWEADGSIANAWNAPVPATAAAV